MSRRHASTIAHHSAGIALGAPQVIAHRLTRMAAAGWSPSARDRREFHRMGHEKVAASQEAWAAMWTQAFTMQQALWTSWAQAWAAPWSAPRGSTSWSPWLGVWAAGLTPIHRTVDANVRRLSRPSSR